MKELICIVCPNGCRITVDNIDGEWIIKGNLCPKGKEFAINEMINPKRSICSTVKTSYDKMPRLPVKTDGEIPKCKIFDIIEEINKININHKIHSGEIIIEDVLGTGINIVATSDMYLWIEEE